MSVRHLPNWIICFSPFARNLCSWRMQTAFTSNRPASNKDHSVKAILIKAKPRTLGQHLKNLCLRKSDFQSCWFIGGCNFFYTTVDGRPSRLFAVLTDGERGRQRPGKRLLHARIGSIGTTLSDFDPYCGSERKFYQPFKLNFYLAHFGLKTVETGWARRVSQN